MGRAWLALVLLFCAASATLPDYRPEMTGSDYGDAIDSLRARLDSHANEDNPDDAGNLGQIRELLKDIKRSLIREQQSAEKMFGDVVGKFAARNATMHQRLAEAIEWIGSVRSRTKDAALQIVNFTRVINSAPAIIQKFSAKKAKWTSRETSIQHKIDASNVRFHLRTVDTKEFLVAGNHVLKLIGRNKASAPAFDTTLKASLNTHYNPKIRELISKVGAEKVFTTQDDLDDLRDLFARLQINLHDFLHTITSNQVSFEARWGPRLDEAQLKLKFYTTQLESAIDSVPESRASIKALVENTDQIHRDYPFKVATLRRLKKSIGRLMTSQKPLLDQYTEATNQRSAQMEKVNGLLSLIKQRYDAAPGLSSQKHKQTA